MTRCPRCTGLFPPAGFYWSKGRRDGYCKECRKSIVRSYHDPERARAAKDRHIAKIGGRDEYNRRERERKRTLQKGLRKGEAC
jgi:hypothetical protein